jgi:NitT/TauT family transport system substrate-binding protein
MKRNVLGGLVVAALAVVIVAGAWAAGLWGQSQPEAVVIASPPGEASTLLYVAEAQGYYAKNGLNVTIRPYTWSSQALAGMERGEADLSLTPEFAVVGEALAGQNLSVIAVIDQPLGFYLVGRRDRGIATFADLAGKTVAVPRRTGAEFYLGRTLDLNGASIENVTMVDAAAAPPEEGVEMVANGSVDASVTALRYALAAQERVGGNAVILPGQNGQAAYAVLTGRDGWAAAHPGAARRLLSALNQAAAFTSEHPAEARGIVQNRLQLDPAFAERMWSDHQFGLSLDRSLVIAMSDEARWMIANSLTNATSVPDMSRYIDPAPLAKVDPAAVGIIRSQT